MSLMCPNHSNSILNQKQLTRLLSQPCVKHLTPLALNCLLGLPLLHHSVLAAASLLQLMRSLIASKSNFCSNPDQCAVPPPRGLVGSGLFGLPAAVAFRSSSARSFSFSFCSLVLFFSLSDSHFAQAHSRRRVIIHCLW